MAGDMEKKDDHHRGPLSIFIRLFRFLVKSLHFTPSKHEGTTTSEQDMANESLIAVDKLDMMIPLERRISVKHLDYGMKPEDPRTTIMKGMKEKDAWEDPLRVPEIKGALNINQRSDIFIQRKKESLRKQS